VVFTAHDPQLDRKVAIKVLRSEIRAAPTGPRLDERLLREAQAMAQLSHPNVVAVHDVGTFGDRIFIAMELVDGQTLAHWLTAARRPQRDVIAMFIAAGRGLVAAHTAGLVHRDFKPENVLVGNDGRVRVTDFGLAHRAALAVEPTGASGAVADRGRTTTGVLAGTPFYMAPEQLAGERVDARGDQFSFCVALYAALTGQHPFRARGRTEGANATRPPRSAMPRWLWRALDRGLAVARDHRYPSMDALLSRLERPRRGWQLALGATLVGAAVAAAVVGRAPGPGPGAALHDPGPACTGAERLLTGIWDEPRTRVVDAAFRATGRSDAGTSFASAALLLDQYAKRWIAMRTQACERALRSDQSEAVMGLRVACFEARLSELRELVDRLAAADPAVVDRAGVLVRGLGTLDVCANDRTLLQPTQPDLVERPSAMLALDAAGRPSYFVTDSDHTLWQIRKGLDGVDRDRTYVIDGAVGYPTMVVDAAHRAQLFVRRVEHTLWHGWQDAPDGPWRGELITDAVTDDPGVALAGDRLVAFVRKTDGWLWRYWQDAPSGTTWTGVRVADIVAGRPGVGLDVAGELYAFVRKPDSSLWFGRHRGPDVAPDRPVKLTEGVASDPTFMRDAAGKMTYYVRTTDGYLMSGYQDVAGSALWHRFLLTDEVAGAPALAFDAEGKQICMIRKRDGSLWSGTQDRPAFGPWHEAILATGVAGDPAIVRDRDDRTIFVVRKVDGSLWQGWQAAASGATSREQALPWSSGGNVRDPR
jgi:hypothetical protein